MPDMVTWAGLAAVPQTEQRTSVAVLASVAGTRVTPWLQNPLGPAARFGAPIPDS